MPTTAYAVTITPPVAGGFYVPVEVRFEHAAAPAAEPNPNPAYLVRDGSTPLQGRTLISDVTTFYFVATTAVLLSTWAGGDDQSKQSVTPAAYATPTAVALGPTSSGTPSADLSSRYAPQQRWATGYYYLPGDVRDVLVPTLNQVYAVPMEVWSAAIDRIFVEVTTTGAAGSVVRLGVYAPDATTGLPNALLVDAGTIDGTSATGQEKTIALSSLVPGQMVWVVAVAQVAAPTVRALSATNGHPMVGATTINTTIGASVKGAYYMTGVSGALPSTFTVAGSVVKPPMIGLRAA